MAKRYSMFPNVSPMFLDEMYAYALDFWCGEKIFLVKNISAPKIKWTFHQKPSKKRD